MPRSGHSEHPAGVRHQFGMLSAFSVEQCRPSCWNTVRHQHGIVSAMAWNTQLSSPTVPTSGTSWSTSGWRQSRLASRQHAGRRCGMGAMCRWAMVSRLSQIGARRPNRRRTLRSISASVGKGRQQRFGRAAGLRLSLPKNVQTEKSRATGADQALRQAQPEGL